MYKECYIGCCALKCMEKEEEREKKQQYGQYTKSPSEDQMLCFTSAMISKGKEQWLWYFWFAHIAYNPERQV